MKHKFHTILTSVSVMTVSTATGFESEKMCH